MNRNVSIEFPLEITRDDGPPLILVVLLVVAVFAFVFLTDPSFVSFEQAAAVL